MSNQPRTAKVWAALLTAMTVGAIVLMALGNNPPSAGAFSLWSYSRLGSVNKATVSQATQSPTRWNCIEVFYSNTKAGNLQQLASINGLPSEHDLNFQFCVGNGLGARDGQIQPTEKWRKQWSSIPGKTWYGTGQTIRICIIADGKNTMPTDYQIKRTDALIEELARKFNIDLNQIYYPNNWQ
ncbi:MAG: hypothetical protein FVQ80_01190 [Planctomycetes bacterium]|nr:hypothetical protein [Planctomycetota bacterium]